MNLALSSVIGTVAGEMRVGRADVLDPHLDTVEAGRVGSNRAAGPIHDRGGIAEPPQADPKARRGRNSRAGQRGERRRVGSGVCEHAQIARVVIRGEPSSIGVNATTAVQVWFSARPAVHVSDCSENPTTAGISTKGSPDVCCPVLVIVNVFWTVVPFSTFPKLWEDGVIVRFAGVRPLPASGALAGPPGDADA